MADSTPVRRMLLVLSRSPEQEAALDRLLQDQQTPGSPHYRQWLTPEEFGATYGPADADVQTITTWLNSEGFQVNAVSAGKTVVEFSGTVAEVRQAFHTQMHRFAVNGEVHYANASNPEIPAALAPVVKGIASLNNFPRKAASRSFGVFARNSNTGEVTPEYTLSNGNGPYYAVGPADFATIYNTQTLRTAGVDGRGQTIAIIGISNINPQDIADFRDLFGLGSGNTSVVVDGSDPGIIQAAEFEAVLDTEWANAVAPGASVVLVVGEDTEATAGTDLAALHVIENNLAGVLSVSFGYCEASLGTTENQFIQSLWQQAAAQGITVVVSSGDNGSAGCDDFNSATMAHNGLAVNGLASTPYNVAAGGTDFDDAGSGSLYWSSTNNTTTRQSAKSYIPERTWNNSCAATATAANLGVCPALPGSGTPPDSLNILAGSGGASNCSRVDGSGACQGTPKPAWQSGKGVPNDGVRDLPDISLFSAIGSDSNSAYVVCMADALNGYPSCKTGNGSIYFLTVGGTSVAAPTFAAIVAMAEQKAGTRLGNINYLLYSLAAKPGASCTSSSAEPTGCIFNDVVKGNIAVPCLAGSPNCSVTSGSQTGVLVDSNGNPAHSTQAGYDLATGLGSVNGANLVNAIANAVAGFKPSTTALTLNGATTQVSAKHGDPISVGVSVSPTAATGSVALLGAAAGFDQNVLSGGMANWSSRMFPGGSYNVTAHYAGDGTRGASDSNGVPVSIAPEDSKTFVSLVTYDLNGNLISHQASTAAYGSPYFLRMDVGDGAATVSDTQGVSSSCLNHITSCPTGKLTVTSNGAPLDGGTFPLGSDGTAVDWSIQLSPGTYSINAAYPGDASYNASSGSTSVTISKAPTTITTGITGSDPFTYGTLNKIYGNVATTSNGVAPTGSVTFFDNGTEVSTCCTNQSPGSGSSSSAYLNFSAQAGFVPVGSHSLTAQYAGDSNYSASTSAPFVFTVVKATPTVSNAVLQATPSTPIVPVTMSLNFVGTASAPTGTISFTDNGDPIPGNVNYSTFDKYFSATLTYTFTQLGTHNIVATYSGDTNYTAATQSFAPLTVDSKIPTSVQNQYVSLNPALVNYPTHFIAYVNAAAYNGNIPPMTGTISFLDNGTAVGTPTQSSTNSGRQATLDYAFTSTGAHNITIQYSGDAVFAASQSQPISIVVTDKLTPQVNNVFGGGRAVVQQTAYVAATVNGSPSGPAATGTITFLDNGTSLSGPVSISSYGSGFEGTLSYTFTATGIHNITAQYSGDEHYTAATSSQPYALSVEGPLWVNLSGGNATTLPSSGGTVGFQVAVDNNTAGADNVIVSCTPDSASARCNVVTPTFTIPANSTYYPSLNIILPANTSSLRKPGLWSRASGLLFCGVFIGAGLLPGWRRKLGLVAILLALALCLLSCGSGGGAGTVTGGGAATHQPATYKFTITATDGNGNSASQVYTATVQ